MSTKNDLFWTLQSGVGGEGGHSTLSTGFPGGSAGKESTCNVGGMNSIPGLGKSPGEGKGYSLQYSGPENSMDRIVHGATESDTT